MPIYEYECPQHGRFEKLRSMEASSIPALCPDCDKLSERIMSFTYFFMGFKFLKGKSEKSPPAPTDPGYHPVWDEAYQGPQVIPKASEPK